MAGILSPEIANCPFPAIVDILCEMHSEQNSDIKQVKKNARVIGFFLIYSTGFNVSKILQYPIYDHVPPANGPNQKAHLYLGRNLSLRTCDRLYT